MDLKVTPHDGYVLAQISGPLDESAREQFREKDQRCAKRAGAQLGDEDRYPERDRRRDQQCQDG